MSWYELCTKRHNNNNKSDILSGNETIRAAVCVCVCRLAVDGVWRLCVHLPHEHRWQRTEQRACVCVCMCWAKMNDVFGLLFVFVGPNDGRYFCHVCGGVRLVFEYCYGWRLRRPNCVSVCVTDTSFSLSVFRVIGVSAIEIVVPLLVWDLNENEFHTHVNYAPTRRTCRYSFDFILCECMPPGSFMRRMRILWRRKLRRQNLTYACLGEYFYNFAGQIETKKNPIFTSQWKWYPFPRCERKTFDGISLTWNSIKNTFIQDDLHRTCAQCTKFITLPNRLLLFSCLPSERERMYAIVFLASHFVHVSVDSIPLYERMSWRWLWRQRRRIYYSDVVVLLMCIRIAQ